MIRKSKEKTIAIQLRKKGYSYSEILQEVNVAKSTLSEWLKSIKLTKTYKQRLIQKRKKAQLLGIRTIKEKRRRITQKLINQGIQEIGSIKQKELLVIGSALYWAEGSKQKENNVSQRVIFANSDPAMVKVFLAYLKNICKITQKRIGLEVYLHESVSKTEMIKIKNWWRTSLRLPKNKRIKLRLKRGYRKTRSKKVRNYLGTLRITVAKSTNLNRKISGRIKGIVQNYNGEWCNW